ncbi:conserved hypothetical protein [Vibrio phage 424E50-1]|nr:conserved hypothetical protein [Vibrio phage 424E50-1]
MKKVTTTLHLRDPQGRRIKSLESIHAIGDWQFIQLVHYTSASPWAINQGNTNKLTFQESDITYIAGNGLEVNYDYTDQLFRPQQLNDLYFSEIRFKAKCSNQNGYANFLVTSPSFTYNPITGATFSVPKGAGVEQFVTVNGSIFVGEDLKENGFELSVQSGSGDFSIYDISLLSCRVGSGA